MARNNRNTEKEDKKDRSWILAEKTPVDRDSLFGYEITYLTGDEEGTIAYGQVVIHGAVAIKAGLVHSKGGHDFWSFPSKKGKEGNWYDDVIPVSKDSAAELKKMAEECVDLVLDELLPEQEENQDKKKSGRR